MKNLVLALSVITMGAFASGSASSFPTNSLSDALSSQNIVEQAQRCGRGMYWCPGRISGCCRVGWACGSRVCYRAKTRSSAAASRNKIPGGR